MPKISRWFFGFFLAMLAPSVLILCAKEPSPDAVVSPKVISSASEASTPGIDNAVQMAQEEVRDPFVMVQAPEPEIPTAAPAGAHQTPAPEIKVELQGIGFGSKDAYAVIGGEVFYKGDEKNGIKLLEVRKREVDILVNGAKVTFLLFPDQDLQKAKQRAEQKRAVKNVSPEQPAEMSSS